MQRAVVEQRALPDGADQDLDASVAPLSLPWFDHEQNRSAKSTTPSR